MSQQLHFTNCVGEALDGIIAAERPASVLVVTDTGTSRLVLPVLRKQCASLAEAPEAAIAAGDDNKTLASVKQVWQALERQGATRHSMVVNLGGGVVTDLGGFAAATFKRGIRFVNCPTTLLGAVDAAVGGKTGVNFQGLKNEIGAFAPACHVVLSTCFFGTLPREEVASGYAEMLKHGLLDSKEYFAELLAFDLRLCAADDMLPLLERSVGVKRRIVEQDPFEHGVRRALNLGHTVGHALESLALERQKPVPHGQAVAWGLVAESVLWHTMKSFPSATMHQLASFVRGHYPPPEITCDDYPKLLQLMAHDKKSRAGEINCTLLADCGKPVVDCAIEPERMTAALDIARDLLGQ